MSFSSRLKERREYLGMTRAQFADKLNITASAIGNYENGISFPKEEILYKIFETLQIDPNYLWQDDVKNREIQFLVSCPERDYIEKYRDLDDHGRRMVDVVLEEEMKRVAAQMVQTPLETIEMRGFSFPASAGRGIPLDDCEEEIMRVPSSPLVTKADYVIKVRGDSMAPFYEDNDILFVRKQDDVNHGEVGIFVLNGEGFVKRLYSKNGDVRLKSINIDYDDIIIKEYDIIQCRGKVIGKA